MTSTSFAPRQKRAVPTTQSPERSRPTLGSALTKARLASMGPCRRQPLPTWLTWGPRFGAAIASQPLGALSPLARPSDRRSTSRPIWKPGSRNTSTFLTSCPNSPTCNRRGCYWPSAPHHARSIPCARSPLLPPRATRPPTTRPLPAPSQRSNLAKLRGCLTLPRNSRSSRPDWVGSACILPRAPKKLRTGRRGPTYFLSSIPGHPPSPKSLSPSLNTGRLRQQRASNKPTKQAGTLTFMAGHTAPAGPLCSATPPHHLLWPTVSLLGGAMVGNTPLLSQSRPTTDKSACCLPCPPPTEPSSAPKLDQAPGHGFSQCHLTLAPHCLPRPWTSPFGAGSAYLCPSLPPPVASTAEGMAVAGPYTRTATTRLPAPARAPWPDARQSSSVPGCGWHAKP